MTVHPDAAGTLPGAAHAAAALPDAVDAATALPAVTLQTGVTLDQPTVAAVTLVTYAVLSFLVAAGAAAAYRWYTHTDVPEGLTVLAGVALVALYLNTTSLGTVVGGGESNLFDLDSVLFNVLSLGTAALAAPIGRRTGDRAAATVAAVSGARSIEGEVSGLVSRVGGVTTVTLPEADDIGDIESYDPVAADRKEGMAEATLVFPRKLSPEELRDRLVARLKEDYGVGHVDVDIAADGTVEYLALGTRAAGVGQTLPPGTAAVAVRADPPNAATPGDTVQVWRGGPDPERVATAELRATADDVVTLALDAADATGLDEGPYRLVTLPAEPQADREFAALLRNADETMAAVTVGAGLAGTTVGDLGPVAVAVRPGGGSVEALPRREYTFAAGDVVYLVGRPDALRRVEERAGPVDAPDAADATDATDAADTDTADAADD